MPADLERVVSTDKTLVMDANLGDSKQSA